MLLGRVRVRCTTVNILTRPCYGVILSTRQRHPPLGLSHHRGKSLQGCDITSRQKISGMWRKSKIEKEMMFRYATRTGLGR